MKQIILMRVLIAGLFLAHPEYELVLASRTDAPQIRAIVEDV